MSEIAAFPSRAGIAASPSDQDLLPPPQIRMLQGGLLPGITMLHARTSCVSCDSKSQHKLSAFPSLLDRDACCIHLA